jgi:hypothetical protein
MNGEFEFEAFDEQPFFFETEEEDESSRRGRMPSRRFVSGSRSGGRNQTFSRRPVMGQRFGPGFPMRYPFRPVRPAWPGWFTPSYLALDEPIGGTFDSDAPQNPPDSTSAPDAVEGAPPGVESAGPEGPSGPSDAADDSSEFYLEFESNGPGSSSSTTFVPAPVENPGGGRIKNKQPPDRTELVSVRGMGQRQIPLHRLAATALQALINAARADGLAEPLLRPVSGFRDPARQAQLWQHALAKYGSPEEARKWVAPPGGSAHQSGRAIDFYLGGRNASTNVAQLKTVPAYRWLVTHARRFGFYPYEREPWHWEYNPPVAVNRQRERNRGFNEGGIESKKQPTAARSAQGAPHGPFGTLTSNAFGRQFSYRFTAEDVLWTARFLVGEASGRDDLGNRAVIWAMFNRYALFTHTVYPTFHQFIRAYSTPLQPVLRSAGAARRHMNEPTFVRTGGNYPGTDVPRGQTQRHLRLQATPWSQLPASARLLAAKALKGQIPNPIGNASEFGSTYVYFHDRNRRYPNAQEWQRYTEAYAKQKKWTWIGPVPGLNQRGNAFFIQRRAANLPANTVHVTPQTESEFESENEWNTPYRAWPEMSASPQVRDHRVLPRPQRHDCNCGRRSPAAQR